MLLIIGCNSSATKINNNQGWQLSVLPSSIRMDPATNEIHEHSFDAVESYKPSNENLLEKNWVFDGNEVNLYGARGEYISFQLVLTNNTDSPLKGVLVDMESFKKSDAQFDINPELFLEWAVEVKTKSTGYPKASLGKGWYPDALIPFECVQADSSKVGRWWIYPLELPDFNNRIDDQRSMLIWVDQYIPLDESMAKPGVYTNDISMKIGDELKRIPINLHVWDFAVPNENKLKASLQHEGFLSRKDEELELEIYQLFKRNRVALMDPTYDPDLKISKQGKYTIGWDSFDARLDKYFTGEAFTKDFGYAYGPGYGEPIESFILPFDVYGKHGTLGWPDVGTPDVERNPENKSKYIGAIKTVRDHLKTMIDPDKTEISVYLNGLDESYFPEAWDRMVYYGDIFKEYYPEARFRIDGSYSEEAMQVVKNSIGSWASHTLNYDYNLLKKYQEMGIEDWLYGPMLYESKVNSWVGSSTFVDLPLVNDRAISWSSWKYHTYSWIGWGVGPDWERAWYDSETRKNTYKSGADSDANFTFKKLNGNALLIYSPGIVANVDVVCPSIRLKTMRDGVQEYEYMRLLSEKDGNRERVDEIVNDIIKDPFGPNAIGNLDVWSFDAEQWDSARIKMGNLISEFDL
ncbi:MAG: DUF4091 domain-containing protein [Cyclobacteriaceae bacterium]|nr:DUF4091 domain-containing protein [Cyclobacteriaceae bacterium]